MTENKNQKSKSNGSVWGASGNAPQTRESLGLASNNVPLKESLNAPTRQLNGSQDVPNTSTRGKQVSSKITADD